MTEKLKICMVGATGVGKTSLVSRFVQSAFSDRYETTIGVKILRRRVVQGGQDIELVVWDLSGEDEFQHVQPAYLRGALGYLLVADGTRPETLDVARTLQARAQAAIGPVPLVLVLNKADLVSAWQVREREERVAEERGWPVVRASAKTGEGVERAFDLLVAAIRERGRPAWI